MNLRIFLNQLPRGGVGDFAKAVGVSSVYLSQLASSQDGREPSPALCVAIESAAEQQVMRWDLRPKDWFRIWPELVCRTGAPQVGEVAEAKVGA